MIRLWPLHNILLTNIHSCKCFGHIGQNQDRNSIDFVSRSQFNTQKEKLLHFSVTHVRWICFYQQVVLFFSDHIIIILIPQQLIFLYKWLKMTVRFMIGTFSSVSLLFQRVLYFLPHWLTADQKLMSSSNVLNLKVYRWLIKKVSVDWDGQSLNNY